MICPHCSTGVRLDFRWHFAGYAPEGPKYGYELGSASCPECEHLVVRLRDGRLGAAEEYETPFIAVVRSEQPVFPNAAGGRRIDAPEVPGRLRQDFNEAAAVLPISPKASAALTRRILQDVLRSHFSIRAKSLSAEIDAFLAIEGAPTYLTDAIDAVRQLGNIAAHPAESFLNDAIIDVQIEEADWLLEVVESLFDYAYIQPARLAQRRTALNEKLEAMGKPPMKRGSANKSTI